jgi:hypothetical protein
MGNELFLAGGQTDRQTHDEAISRFSQFCKAPKMVNTSGVLKYTTVLCFKGNVICRCQSLRFYNNSSLIGGYSLKVVLFRIFLVYIVIMTIELYLCNDGVSTSCYVHIIGQCSVNIQISMFGMCVRCEVKLPIFILR